MKKYSCDIAIVGGGLSGGLIALAIHKKHPNMRIALINDNDELGGNHIWSFFVSDIPKSERWLIAPLICHGWKSYEVKFPDYERKIDTPYYSIMSEQLDLALRGALEDHLILTHSHAIAVNNNTVLLSDGTRIESQLTIDTRGTGDVSYLNCGWQKFMGMIMHFDHPHNIKRPIIMDATVDQLDGYRFVYTLPISPVDLFVEDTYYSDTPDLDMGILSQRIFDYAKDNGWAVEHVSRTETGVLPVIKSGDFIKYWDSTGGDNIKGGMRAALCHPLTGYSLPYAVSLACKIAKSLPIDNHKLAQDIRSHSLSHWKATGYYRLLSKMMFDGAEPDERYHMLSYFYRKDKTLIEKFYAARLSFFDKMRFLIGKPPIPVTNALKVILSYLGGIGK